MAIRTAKDFSLKPKAGAKHGNLYRPGGAGGVIWCRFFLTRDGRKREFRKSTGEVLESEARARAWAWHCEHSQARAWPAYEVAARVLRVGDVVDMLEAHRREVCWAEDAAWRRYRAALVGVVSLAYPGQAWRNVRLSALDGEAVARWQRERYRLAGRDLGKDGDISPKLNVSLNSLLTQARSVFGVQAVEWLRRRGVAVPDTLERFVRARRLRPEASTYFVPIPAAALANIEGAAAQVISGGVVPGLTVDMALAVELARYCGLTAREIASVEWGWVLEVAPGRWVIEVRNTEDFQTKRGKKQGRVPVAAERVAAWRLATGGAGRLVGSPAAVRKAGVWLASYLPGRERRLHELRKQAGSEVFSRHGSLSKAAAFLRDSEATARRYYLADLHQAGALGVEPL